MKVISNYVKSEKKVNLKSHNRTIYIFSTGLPKDITDDFMRPELDALCLRDINIILFPFFKSNGNGKPLNKKVKVNFCMESYYEGKYTITLSLLILFIRVMAIDIRYNKGSSLKVMTNTVKSFSYFKSLYFKSEYLNDMVGEFEPSAVFYSYWWQEWNLILILLKLKGQLRDPLIVTRAHGFDLYTERQNNHILFRGLQIRFTDRVYTISKNGENYLKSKYKFLKGKIFNSYLGTYDKGYYIGNCDFSEFNLVSVSDFREVKRVWLIPEILQHIKLKINWTHIGEGKGLEEIKENVRLMSLPENIKWEFKGYVKNDELYELFKSKEFHLFVNVSSSEGLPVSIMEAISTGIPVVATNVGGTNEIINKETGFLIEKDFDPKIAAQKITEFLTSLNINQGFKKRTRTFWKSNFDYKINCTNFLNHLLS